VCIWSVNDLKNQEIEEKTDVFKPKVVLISRESLNNVDHSADDGVFVTSGQVV